ncbi:MAG TPA: toprim domain-containing protein, partial [Campylobacterales bacterium]|nr:toprim domain-containing protein [Campylobacterales bacterium]
KHWSHQKINTNFKGLVEGGKKEGNFFIIGDKNLTNAQELIIVEGYATGASIHKATQKTVIVAVDSGNLKPVSQAIHQKYPKTTLLIAGDDDIQQELKGKTNAGKEKAIETASLVSGHYTLPKFTQSEIKQGMTDFNDLAQLKGLKEVKRLIDGALKKAHTLEKHKQKEVMQQNQEQQKIHKREIARKNSVGISR